jgi:spore coat polysaccharide biosynthesis protein SpsF
MKRALLVTARLKSTRLKEKALVDIDGRALLRRLLDRAKAVTWAEAVIVCTSQLRADDPIAQLAEEEDVNVFRSEPDDVLLRLTQCAETFDLHQVLNCTADNPFVDPAWLDRLAKFHEDGGYDYSRPEGLPLGGFGFALRADAMKHACFLKAEKDSEVWGPYFTETGKFQCGLLKATDDVRWPELRLTVDTPEDLELARRIAEAVDKPGALAPLATIVEWCRRHPEAVALNAHVLQKPAKPIRLRAEAPSSGARPLEGEV